MDRRVYNRFREIIQQESGITLGEEKIPLLQNRIAKRLRSLNLPSESAYLKIIESDLDGEELYNLIDCISTNVTYFYRESAHFDFLNRELARWKASGKAGSKIWCAASSSGEEPYTIAMSVAEAFGYGSDHKILATDISRNVLHHATQAVYDTKQLRDLPPPLRDKYFERRPSGGAGTVKVHEGLQRMVLFRRFNLAEFPYPLKGPLDFIFCRNVMIYFSIDLRRRLIHEFSRLLAPGGFLIVGHSENLLGIEHSLKTVQSGIYRKN